VCKQVPTNNNANTEAIDQINTILSRLDERAKQDTIQAITVNNNNITNNNTTNNTNSHNTNNININIGSIQNFLHEDISYISEDFIMKCAKRLENGLFDLIKTIRFNPEHPENMNVKLHVKRDKTLYVYQNNAWEICDGKWTLEEMVMHGARVINQTFLTNVDRDKLVEEDSSESRIQTWLLNLLPRDNDRLIGKISKRLYALILNNVVLLMEEENDNMNEIIAT